MHLDSITFDSPRYPDTDSYPFNLDLLRVSPGIKFDSPVTFFTGENGSGKTTVLKAMCLRCGIHIWQDELGKRVLNNPHEEDLYRYITVNWHSGSVPGSYFSSQTFQDFTKFLDEWAAATPEVLQYYGGSSLITKSHGQSLMAYFKSRYAIRGLYFLDEPEAALSPRNQIAFLDILQRNAAGGHAQFIICTQSPILLACPDARILSFDQSPIQPIEYEDTDHFKIYRDFLNDRGKFLGA